MSSKNLLDNLSATRRPAIFSDLTGKEDFEPRLDITETLLFLHETYLAMTAANPTIDTFAVRFAVPAICYHMGWLPYEIAAAEQYIAQTSIEAVPSAG